MAVDTACEATYRVAQLIASSVTTYIAIRRADDWLNRPAVGCHLPFPAKQQVGNYRSRVWKQVIMLERLLEQRDAVTRPRWRAVREELGVADNLCLHVFTIGLAISFLKYITSVESNDFNY